MRVIESNVIVLLLQSACSLYSMSGHRVTLKELAFYSATKYAVTALTEGLRLELAEAKSHIRISVT